MLHVYSTVEVHRVHICTYVGTHMQGYREAVTGRLDLKPLDVVKKLSMVVTPSITRAGT